MALSAGDTVRSLDAIAYYNTGTYASPTWAVIDIAENVTIGLTKGEKVLKFRGKGWDVSRSLLKAGVFTLVLHHVVDNSALAAFQSAFDGNSEIEVALMSGAITDVLAEGPRVTCEVFDFSRNEEIENTLMYNVVLKPSSFTNDPEWINGSA